MSVPSPSRRKAKPGPPASVNPSSPSSIASPSRSTRSGPTALSGQPDVNEFGVASMPSWITEESLQSEKGKTQRQLKVEAAKRRSKSPRSRSPPAMHSPSRPKSRGQTAENASILKEDARILESKLRSQETKDRLNQRVAAAKKRTPVAVSAAEEPHNPHPSSIASRVAEKKEALAAAAAVVPKYKDAMAPPDLPAVNIPLVTLLPVHPDDPKPTCIPVETRSAMLVPEIIFKVAYIHPTLGFRNEMMAIPVTRTVTELGNILREYTSIRDAKFMYTPNSYEHKVEMHKDVARHARRVEFEHDLMNVQQWGLKNDDVITVKGTRVEVPKPTRADLLAVKCSVWKSESPRVLSSTQRGLELGLPSATSSPVGRAQSPVKALTSVSGTLATDVPSEPLIPNANGRVKLVDALGARKAKSRFESAHVDHETEVF